jgi:hypothetical protein
MRTEFDRDRRRYFGDRRSRGPQVSALRPAAGAEYIATGSKRHFPRNLCGTIRVVSAGELLDRVTLEI